MYFYEEFVTGKALPIRKDEIPIPITPGDLVLLRSLAKWFISLESITFPKFGSLHFEKDDTITLPDIGTSTDKIVIGLLVRFNVSHITSPYFAGPYSTAKEMYLDLIDNLIQQTLDGKRYPPSREIEGYLTLLEVRTLVEGCKELDEGLGYIKHGDDKGDNWMVDESGALTNIIDWERSVAPTLITLDTLSNLNFVF